MFFFSFKSTCPTLPIYVMRMIQYTTYLHWIFSILLYLISRSHSLTYKWCWIDGVVLMNIASAFILVYMVFYFVRGCVFVCVDTVSIHWFISILCNDSVESGWCRCKRKTYIAFVLWNSICADDVIVECSNQLQSKFVCFPKYILYRDVHSHKVFQFNYMLF